MSRRRALVAVASLVLVGSACAGGGETATTTASTAEAAPPAVESVPTTAPLTTPTNQPVDDAAPVAEQPVEPAPADVTVVLPAIDVVNLVDGSTATLDALAQPGATLLWFWAPH